MVVQRRATTGGHTTAIVWTPEMLAWLGREPDTVVAKQLGVSLTVVRKKRCSLGRSAAMRSKAPPLPEVLVKKLGEVSDRSLSVLHGVALWRITDERNRRGIPPAHRPKGHRVRWTRSVERRLGRVTDSVIGKLLRCSPGAVARRRQQLGIPAHGHPSLIKWTDAMLADVGQAPDGDLAKRWGINVVSVSTKRRALGRPIFRPLARFWTAARVALLGVEPDAVLARRWRIHPTTIQSHRINLGRPPARICRAILTASQRRLLGTATDRDLSRRWGISDQTVRRHRRAAGIPAYRWDKP